MIVIIIFQPTCLSGFIGAFKKLHKILDILFFQTFKPPLNTDKTKIITPRFHHHFQSFIAYQQTVTAGYIID